MIALLWPVMFMLTLFLFFVPTSATHNDGFVLNDGFEDNTNFIPVSWAGGGCGVGSTGSIQTSGAPEGSNYLRYVTATGEQCGIAQDGIGNSSQWGRISFYSRVSATTCTLGVQNCFSRVTYTFYSDTQEIDIVVYQAEASTCVETAWDGTLGLDCRTVPALCYNQVSATFCQYSDNDLYASLTTFCGVDCLGQIVAGANPVAYVQPYTETQAGTMTSEFDNIFIGEFMPLDPFPEDLSWARNIALVFMVVSVIYLGYDNLVVQRKEPIFG
ncbi:MAG TPA: hypothetical protein VJ327_09840, partial [Patescibacteria group bacterium]|nr:hypothetical protein [Patescibacteria group bacterium]